MSLSVSGDRGDGACASVTASNATSCDGRMTFTINNLSDKTNYTALMTMWNRGGQSEPSHVSVVTQAPSGELLSLAVDVAAVLLQL